MTVPEILEERSAFSFEVFPPKTDVGMEKLCGEGGVLDHLYELRPDYISCTYGAGGTNVGKNLEVLDKIKKDGKAIPVTHFTCIANTKEGIKDQLETYLAHGIDHMLALRGDIPFGWTGTNGDLHYATELVSFVRKEFGDKFSIAVAGSPEGHIACRSLDADVSFLKQKQDEGADYIMTQLCWDMDAFRRWMDKIRGAGIWMPVDVGIMPVLDAAATINMALSRNGCVMDRKLCEIISKHWIFPNPFAPNESEESIAAKKASFKEAGMEYTIRMIDEYRTCGIDGIHLYALNKWEDVTRLVKEAGADAAVLQLKSLEAFGKAADGKDFGGYSLGLTAPVVDGENEWFGHGGAWGTYCMVNWHKRQLKLWAVQLNGGPRPWDKASADAADAFFKEKIDNSGVNAYTGRTN